MMNKAFPTTTTMLYDGIGPTESTGHRVDTGKYRLNRYNWLGHKLIGQHQYKAFDNFRRHLIMATATPAPRKPSNKDEEGRTSKLVKNLTIEQHVGQLSTIPTSDSPTISDRLNNNQRKTSDHLTYLHCLNLMRTTNYQQLDETLLALQQLDLERNSQHFLLLCQCLLFSGNFDSVAALCKQMINKQIDVLSYSSGEIKSGSKLVDFESDESNNSRLAPTFKHAIIDDKQIASNASCRSHLAFSHNNAEFGFLFKQVSSNPLINNPKLWCIFAKSLEYQRQFKDAQLAYQIASSLGNFSVSDKQASVHMVDTMKETKSTMQCVRMCNYELPSLELARFSIRILRQYRHAELVLTASSLNPSIKNNQIDIMLALTRSVLNPNVNGLTNACDIIRSLENHYYSRENPSAIYNQLAQRSSWFKSTIEQHQYMGDPHVNSTIFNECLPADSLDPRRSKPDMTLAKSWLLLSKWTAQNEPSSDANLKAVSSPGPTEKHITELIESIVDHHVSCYRSSGLWNNLGLLFLARRKLVASLSCLLKANQIDPSNWRINFNLALVSHQVGLLTRANLLALTSKNLQLTSQSQKNTTSGSAPKSSDFLVDTLIGLSYDRLSN